MTTMELRYDLTLKKGETKRLDLPDFKSRCLLLRSFEVKSEYKTFDIKLVGKDTIISYGEAVFYQSNKFDLFDRMSQIIDADKIHMIVKNLCTAKDANTVKLSITFHYSKLDDGQIIYNCVFTNLNSEGLSNILKELSQVGKYVTKFVWTSPNKLSSIELIPQFESEPVCLKPIKELVNNQNHIVMNLTEPKYDSNLVNQLTFYNLVIPDNLEKLCVIAYGYNH
jgi:hypothetical protein